MKKITSILTVSLVAVMAVASANAEIASTGITGYTADLNTSNKTNLVAAINEVKTVAEGAGTDLTALENRVSTNETNIGTNTTNIATNTGDIATLKTDKADKTDLKDWQLKSERIATYNKDATNKATTYPTVTAAEEIAKAAADAVSTDLTALENRVSTNETNIDTNTTNIATNTGDIATLKTDKQDKLTQADFNATGAATVTVGADGVITVGATDTDTKYTGEGIVSVTGTVIKADVSGLETKITAAQNAADAAQADATAAGTAAAGAQSTADSAKTTAEAALPKADVAENWRTFLKDAAACGADAGTDGCSLTYRNNAFVWEKIGR